MRRSPAARFRVLVAVLLVSACNGRRSDERARPTASTTQPASSSSAVGAAVPSAATTGDDTVIPPTFATLRFVLTATMPPCVAADCHHIGGPNRLQYAVKEPDRLYETLTHHVSVDCGNIPVVTPGSPEKSAIVKVLKGPCSAKVPQMPNGCQPALGNCLPANYVTAIERWIAAGAPKD